MFSIRREFCYALLSFFVCSCTSSSPWRYDNFDSEDPFYRTVCLHYTPPNDSYKKLEAEWIIEEGSPSLTLNLHHTNIEQDIVPIAICCGEEEKICQAKVLQGGQRILFPLSESVILYTALQEGKSVLLRIGPDSLELPPY